MRSTFWRQRRARAWISALILVLFGSLAASMVGWHRPVAKVTVAKPPQQPPDDPALIAALTRGGPPLPDPVPPEIKRPSLPVDPLQAAEAALSETRPSAGDLNAPRDTERAKEPPPADNAVPLSSSGQSNVVVENMD